ncbi:MAG: hypothetical protein IPM54_19890 [Polyangiaceae bacterium]|nr:hypothetical protein [Polyangiaceae bacterium]
MKILRWAKGCAQIAGFLDRAGDDGTMARTIMRHAYVGPVLLAVALASLGCDTTVSGKDWDRLFDDALTELSDDGGSPVFDCDDLPELTPEDEALGPMSPPPLEKSITRSDGSPHRFLQLPDVALSGPVADKVDELDDAYFKRTGKHLTVTSGARDAVQQAKAMYKMMRLGGDPMRLYRNKEAAREIKRAYEQARAKKKSPDDVVGAVHSVIQKQMARGIYISAHLRAGAVDVRSRDLTRTEKKHFAKVVAEMKDVQMLEEFTPPHFHLQID